MTRPVVALQAPLALSWHRTLHTENVNLGRTLQLQRGGSIPAESMHVRYADWGREDGNKPTILLCPSMSNTPFPIDDLELGEKGWWNQVVGYGSEFGIDLETFRVICPSPLGSPHGSSSPLTPHPEDGRPWGHRYPAITPADMADAHAMLLDHLGVGSVHAVVGGSMGGMQALQFACRYPNRFQRCAAIAGTGHTSPSTVALRAVQRSAIRLDPDFRGGRYYAGDPVENSAEAADGRGPVAGMAVARKFGTICYRSRTEFDGRFDWLYSDEKQSFEVERYLDHQAHKFTNQVRYDANCYLLLSKAMDLMNLSEGAASGKLDDVLRSIPTTREFMMLPYTTDTLMPPSESVQLGKMLRAHGIRSYVETLQSKFGHDSFLLTSQGGVLARRLRAFLSLDNDDGRDGVDLVNEIAQFYPY